MSEALVVKEHAQQVKVSLNFDIVKKYICPLAEEPEIYMFLQICKVQQLNPFLREVYLIKYSKNQPAAIVVGKETFLKRANHNEHYRGFQAGVTVERNTKEGPVIEHKEGGQVLKGEILIGGWCDVYRDDRQTPIHIEVGLDEYVGMKPIYKDNEKVGEEINKMWSGKQATMIRKVAVVQAHREAFPDETGGMLALEELPYIDITDLPTYEMGKTQPGYIAEPQKKAPDPNKASPPCSEPQQKKIGVLMSNCGYDDTKRHARASEILGLSEPVKSMKDLTVSQASFIIQFLDEEEKEMKGHNAA